MKNYWLKRVLAVSLTVAMVLGGTVSVQATESEPAAEQTEVSATASNVETGTIGGIEYTLDNEGTLTLSGKGSLSDSEFSAFWKKTK